MPSRERHSDAAGLRGPFARLRGYHLLAAAGALVLVFALVHGGRVRDNLPVAHWEDISFVRHNASNVHSIKDCFTERPLWPGLYRPLTTNLYYYMGRVAFGNRIEVYHGINVGLYLANAFLLYLICLRILPGWWALIPPVIFASRSSHVEVVLNTCEIQALLSVFFSLLALVLFISSRRGGGRILYVCSLAAYCLALFSKETSLIFPAVLIAYGLLYDKRRAWPQYIPPAALTGIWVILYVFVLRGVTDHEPTGFTYGFGFPHLLTGYAAYVLTFINVLTHRLENLAMVGSVAHLAATTLARLLLAAATVACAAYYWFGLTSRRGRRIRFRAPAFGFAFFLITLSPYVILESRLFMRYAYVGHAGLAITAGAILYCVADRLAGRKGRKAKEEEEQNAWTRES